MGDATRVRGRDEVRVTAAAAIATGEVWQMKDGRAAYMSNAEAAASGDRTTFITEGQVVLTKPATHVFLDGGRAYWDHSANNVTFEKVNDRDFYVGRVVGDAALADTTCVVNLNVDPPYDIDLLRDGALTVLVGTQAVGGFGEPKIRGGALSLELTATNEAQKVDILSRDGFSKACNPIVEIVFLVADDGAGTAVDMSLGIANGTSATDADAITEHVFFHMDANNTNINAQSKDGTTTVTATDTTKDYVEGSAVANRVECWIDARDPADVQLYVDGVNVLPASVFKIDAATGPFFLLAHIEKTASTDVYRAVIDRFQARFAEQ
jgi:predicted RecA/RadA family phage recombinase